MVHFWYGLLPIWSTSGMVHFWYGPLLVWSTSGITHFQYGPLPVYPLSVWFTSGMIHYWSVSAPDILDERLSSTTCHLKLPQCYGFLYCIHCKKGQKGRQRPRDATLITTEERISLPYPMGNFSKKREFAGALNLIHIIFFELWQRNFLWKVQNKILFLYQSA